MAISNSIKFGKQAILLGDGGSPETFAAPVGITSFSKTTNVQTGETVVPDGTDVDALGEVQIDEIARSKRLAGSGLLTTEEIQDWRNWDDNGGEKTVRWFTDLSNAQGGGYYEGAGLLTTFEETGEKGGRWQVNFEVAITGPFPFTPAA